MQTSVFLARLIGPVMALVGISLLTNETAFRKMAMEFVRSPALIFFSGMILMPAGLAVVLSHNVWVLNWPLIITLLFVVFQLTPWGDACPAEAPCVSS